MRSWLLGFKDMLSASGKINDNYFFISNNNKNTHLGRAYYLVVPEGEFAEMVKMNVTMGRSLECVGIGRRGIFKYCEIVALGV